jgi:hypothetical protein
VYPGKKAKAPSSACLVYLTNRKEIARVEGVYSGLPTSGPAKPMPVLAKTKSVSLFEKIYGKKFLTDASAPTTAAPIVQAAPPSESRGPLALFSGPTHLLPPMSKLFLPFMSALLRPAAVEVASAPAPAPLLTAISLISEIVPEKIVSEEEIFKQDSSRGVFEWVSANSMFAYFLDPTSCPFPLISENDIVVDAVEVAEASEDQIPTKKKTKPKRPPR